MNKSRLRESILKWADMGYILPKDLKRASEIAQLYPSKRDKIRFIDLLMLGLGALLLVSGVIFFFAYNWKSLNYFIKFFIVQILIFGTLIIILKNGIDKIGGKVAVMATAILTGALLALIGQTYQTGADTYQLFMLWSIFILPLVILIKFPALWLIELILINTAIVLYYRVFRNFWGFSFNFEKALTMMFIINLISLALWELTLKIRWLTRVLTFAGISMATILIIHTISGNEFYISIPIYLITLAGTYIYFRKIKLDIPILCLASLSAIISVTALLIEVLDFNFDWIPMLMIGLIIISLSALAGWWLKKLSREEG